MTYIIKRKFQGALGDNVDSAGMSSLIQHIQTSTGGLVLDYDTLTVNHIIVERTTRISVGTDKYK